MNEAFVSYATADKTKAAKVKQILQESNITTFLFHDDLEVSTEWRKQILAHLDTSSALVAIVTETFANSIWANQEVGMAIAKGLPVIPLMFGGSSALKGFIEMYQGIPVAENNLEQAVKSTIPLIAKGVSSSSRRIYQQLAVVLSRLITRWRVYKSHGPDVKWTVDAIQAIRDTFRKEAEELLTLTSNGSDIDFGFKGQVSSIMSLTDRFTLYKIDFNARFSENVNVFQNFESVGDQIEYIAKALHSWLQQTEKI